MTEPSPPRPTSPAPPSPGSGPAGRSRRRVSVSSASLVDFAPLVEGASLPLTVRPAQPGLDLATWVGDHREAVEEKLNRHGGLLFRGFGIADAGRLEAVIAAAAGSSLEYKERSSPRSTVAGNIYTSTDYPPGEPIFLHNENSYQQVWPQRIFFACRTAAEGGGATPIADTRKVYADLDPKVRDRFLERGWMYVRNFGHGFGLDWRTVFQTDSKEEVAAHCRASGIEVEWLGDDGLRTRSVRSAAALHPQTLEPVWFNHATFFHVSTLTPAIRDSLLSEFAADELPTNTYYGDGRAIEPEVLDHLRSVYERHTVRFPWQEGDLLMLDNMLAAHGREPFTGARKVLVGMARPLRRRNDDPSGLSRVEAA